ncbi:putative transcription factor C2H2 family [Helianthus annuus]|nr:putative transcription factor C2H2 family [Helianthus annuus]KAJ0864262.1 putative transcription factor C2H2 family [Helianthus annuus]
MEEEMVRMSNIMPVELAIKRELEYRKKMEALKYQHQNDFKPLISAQGPVFESQTPVDRKRKLQPFNEQCSRTLQSSRSSRPSSSRFVCVVCRIAFATAYHLKVHGETSAHKSKLCDSRRGGKAMSNPFLCEVCDIMCSSGRVMEFHVAGIKHATCLREFEDAKRERIYGNYVSNYN